MADPREQFESQLRHALGHVRSRVLARRAELHEKHGRMRERRAAVAERRRAGKR